MLRSTVRKLLVAILFLLTVSPIRAQETAGFDFRVNRWLRAGKGAGYPRYAPEQFREIADNILAYQNADGGWPKNVDMMARLDPDSVVRALAPRYRTSTIDNFSVYTQVAYLAETYRVTGEARYRDGAQRGIEYLLAAQYPNGGWRGWDVDAVTFNDNVMEGVLSLWLDILDGHPRYAWIGGQLCERIRRSWEAGLDLVLRCQWVRDGVRTVWPQQCDHETLQPVKAWSYELPSLSAGESADIVLLLMRIADPSPEVVDAVKAAVAWYDKTKISGKRIVWLDVPEGLPEDRSVKNDRLMVDDPDAGPLWARFYELDDDTWFLCTRAGVKVCSLREMPAERRVGYLWFSDWGTEVLDAYPAWLERVGQGKTCVR